MLAHLCFLALGEGGAVFCEEVEADNSERITACLFLLPNLGRFAFLSSHLSAHSQFSNMWNTHGRSTRGSNMQVTIIQTGISP